MTLLLKNTNTDIQRAEFESLYNDALLCKQNKDYINAIDIYNKIIANKLDIENCVECAKLYEDVGDIYFDLKDTQHALQYFEKALSIYAKNELYDLLLDQYKKIGSLQQGIWQFKKSIDLFQQGLSLANRLGIKERIIEFELLMGNVLNWDEQLEQAEIFLKKVMSKR